MTSPRTIHLEREATDRPWGFRLQGGSDFSIPLSIQLVNPDTPAHACGLSAGDQVIAINGRNVMNLSHQEAKMEITRSGNELDLTVIKGAVNQQSTAPMPQPISQLRTGPVHQMPTPEVAKPSFAMQTQPLTHIGSSHNRAAMPFDARVGNEMTYQAAKPTNWQPGDYTQDVPEHLRPKLTNFETTSAYNKNPLQREVWRPKTYRDNPQSSPSRNVGTAVYHAQYNSPIGLYSDDKVLEAFKSQTGSLIDDIKGTSNNYDSSQASNAYGPDASNQPSPTYQAVMNPQHQQHVPHSSEAKISRSFRMLEQDLSSVQGTSQAPKSIFDQRRQQQQQQQQQQSQHPSGFRSVRPPEEVPPEQQRRPYHTEYQVEHIQEKWMEPKFK